MRILSRALSTLILLALLSAVLPAQAQYTIDKVVFKNAAPYTDAELLAASGLAPGQPFVQDALLTAAHRLLDTGLFSDAQVDYTGQGKNRTVIVTPVPIPLAKLLPVSFENFVWFTPDELTQAIHARVPLYRGVASDAGNFPDIIQTALQQILTEKGITATLSHTIVEPTTRHPALVIDFKVEQPHVQLATVRLSLTGPPGVAAQLAPSLQQAADRATHEPYNEGLTGLTLEDILLSPARSSGYINAKLDTQRTITSSDHGVAITVNAQITSGDPYKVSTLTWEPTPIYSAADFTRDAKLHPGDLASASALTETEAQIANAYLIQGYMDVYILSSPATDTTAHTVAYTLHAIPGDPYHLHILNVTGLSPEARKLFDADWQMKSGDPYSDIAVNTFLRKHVAQPLFRKYNAAFKAAGDPQTHLVDLTFIFTPNGSATY